MHTSCNYDVHDNHYDELLTIYHDSLERALNQLYYDKIPSLDDVKYEVKSKMHQALIALFSVVPVQMIENPEHANPENFLGDTAEAQAVRKVVYGNPKYIELLKEMIPKIIKRGVFD